MYAGVILEDGGKMWSVLNVRGLAIPEFEGRTAEPVVYDGETPEQRIARASQVDADGDLWRRSGTSSADSSADSPTSSTTETATACRPRS